MTTLTKASHQYTFRELCHGPQWRMISNDFTRRSQAEAYARDWLRVRGYTIIDFYYDNENGIDIMTSKDGSLYQYAVDRVR